MATRPALKLFAYLLIVLFMGALAAGNYVVLPHVQAGTCTEWFSALTGNAVQVDCSYYFVGAPLIVGLLLLLLLPALVTTKALPQETQPAPVPPDTKKTAPAPAKSTSDAAIQLLALLQREGRLVDFLREDLQPYDDAQIGAAVRPIHQACRQILTEHITIEPVLNGQEGEEVTVPDDFDPSAIRLTGNVSGDPPFRGALRHAGWRAVQIKLPAQPAGQDPKIIAPAEVEIP